MRFSQNGKVDTTFGGGDGLIIVDAKLPSTATANVIVDTNDNLVVTAHRQSASAISWSATRILGD
jgi:L-fucose mutarotase/ribose pyranase (RbsD/FucU family)